MLAVGLNPYGLTYQLGLQGVGTARANSDGVGLDGFIGLAEEIGASVIELHSPWLAALSDHDLATLHERLTELALTPVIASGLPNDPDGTAIRPAAALSAKTIRLSLTRVLCGDRHMLGADWPGLAASVQATLKRYAARAADHDIWLAIENHQDFTSHELLALCAEAGDNIGICFDIANPFATGEAPLDFAERVATRVRHVHLKDYNVQFTDEGFRLVRSAVGDGAVPIVEIVAILNRHHQRLTASIELAALEARHVRLLRPEWWNGYPPSSGPALAACLAAARHRRLPDDADYRTPWESQEDGQVLIDYELDQLRRSVTNLRALGLMKEVAG